MNEENRVSGGCGKNFWKEHSEAWRLSGLTQKEYCDQKGMNYRSFIYQHHRLTAKSKQSSLKFVEPKQSSTAAASNNQVAVLQLMLRNGIRIGIPPDVNESLLGRVLTLVGRLSC